MEKILKLLLALFLMFSIPCFTGCSEDEEEFGELDLNSTPLNTKLFLQASFPDEMPESIIKSRKPDPETGIQIVATFSNGVKVEFDKEGIWQQILSLDGFSLSEYSYSLLNKGILEVVETNYSDQAVIGIYKKDNMQYIMLADNQQLVFEESRFLGFPMSEYDDIPANARNLMLENFPHIDWEVVLRTNEEGEYRPRYRIWLANGYKLEFNETGEWVYVDGKEELIPTAIVAALPKELLKKIKALYPDARITEMYRWGDKNYQVRVYPNVIHTYDGNR